MNFGQRLERLRKLKNLTQPALVELAGIALGTISKYEKLETASGIAYEYLLRLEGALEMDVALLTGTDPTCTLYSMEQLASRESLKRFAANTEMQEHVRQKLERIQDDGVAPKSVEDWENFWRLAQRVTGRPSPPTRRVDEQPESAQPRKALLKVVPPTMRNKPPSDRRVAATRTPAA